nr:RnfH family protein [uncultured Albidiferax sp.]
MAKLLQVTVAWSPAPREAYELMFELPEGQSVGDALAACEGLEPFAELDVAGYTLGVWGRSATLAQLLQPYDRVELYRPLTVDPKVARRERFASQGARGTGLFAKKRAGAKAGY